MSSANLLACEWERIGLLGQCLAMLRSGNSIGEDIKELLSGLNQSVTEIRLEPPWREMIERYGLTRMDQDILASTLAPEGEPSIGWMFQELQPGLSSHYPSTALVREIFFLDQEEVDTFYERLKPNAPLFRSRLIYRESDDPFQPLRPTRESSMQLLGLSSGKQYSPPGTIEVPVIAGWDDIVLPRHNIQAMKEFMYWVTHRKTVVDLWQGRVGGGPVALFCGPSGTGKSYAAEVLAHALGFPLYRVDMGLLVSKYIGETEKNLNALFDAVEGSNAVLLFDEADTLFGKRGEVKEARDRYANMEVGHLLTRIERHQGPCILTSNLRNNIDSAFARRFQVVIEFSRPTAEERIELWRRHIPSKAPTDKSVDVELLGNEMKLTGGQIHNSAIYAAFLAAGEGSSISLHHIAKAVWIELGKDNRERMLSSLGELADWLQEKGEHVEH